MGILSKTGNMNRNNKMDKDPNNKGDDDNNDPYNGSKVCGNTFCSPDCGGMSKIQQSYASCLR